MNKLDKELMEELNEFVKACGEETDTPATRKAKEAEVKPKEKGKEKGKEHAEPDGDEDLLKGDDEEEDEKEDEEPIAAKSILDDLMDAEADLGSEFDPEILKALDAIGEPEGDTGELLKAVSRQVTRQMAILGDRFERRIDGVEADQTTIKQSQLKMVKAFRKSTDLMNALADSPTGRRSARTSGLSPADFKKAMEAQDMTWDRYLKAVDSAMSKGMIDSHQVARIEAAHNRHTPILEVMAAMPETFKSLNAFMGTN